MKQQWFLVTFNPAPMDGGGIGKSCVWQKALTREEAIGKAVLCGDCDADKVISAESVYHVMSNLTDREWP
jgi:hypothetical protein